MLNKNITPSDPGKAQPQKHFTFTLTSLDQQLIKKTIPGIAVLLLVHGILIMLIVSKGMSVGALEKRWVLSQPQKKDVDSLAAEIKSIDAKIAPIRALAAQRFIWSRALNQLSDAMTSGVWLKRLATQSQLKDAKKQEYVMTLTIDGSSASNRGDETALIALFLKSLQSGDFSHYFSDIQLGPLERSTFGRDPVMNFRIVCYFKQEKGKK